MATFAFKRNVPERPDPALSSVVLNNAAKGSTQTYPAWRGRLPASSTRRWPEQHAGGGKTSDPAQNIIGNDETRNETLQETSHEHKTSPRSTVSLGDQRVSVRQRPIVRRRRN